MRSSSLHNPNSKPNLADRAGRASVSNSVSPSANTGAGETEALRWDLVTTRGGTIAGTRSGSAGSCDHRPDADQPIKDQPAFVHVAPRHMPLPVLIAVPHAGRAYPAEIAAQMRDPGQSKLRLEDRRIDVVGVEIARLTGSGLMVAHAPRAMLDLNRAADDIDWGMVAKPTGFSKHAFLESLNRPSRAIGSGNARARSGLGLVPRRLPGSGEIWRSTITPSEVQRRIENIHQPYHEFLQRELVRIRDAWGTALLIDLHSMPPLRRRDGEEKAPRIVLGDRYGASCDSALANTAFRYLDQHGCTTAHNRPYSGGYVLDRHAKPARGIHGIQVEVCRSTYLDAKLSETTSHAQPLAKMLAGLVRILGAQTAGLGSGGLTAQAAE